LDKKCKVLTFAILLLLSTLLQFNMPILSAAQPPIDTTTYYNGTIGQPRRLDPARAYDTASGEVIMNVYEPLIFFADKPALPETGGYVAPEKYANLGSFTPILATALPTITDYGHTWTFTIRSGVKFHPWTKADGTVVTGQILTAEDVEYTFERAFVQDQIGSPMWMFTMPLFGFMWAGYDGGYDETTEMDLATLIDAAVTRSGNTVSFHFQNAWPQTVMMQMFAQTWGSIVNKAFCIEHGCWDGVFAPGWWDNYHAKPSNSYSPLDNYYAAKSLYDSASSVPAMCGTGPYKFNYWNRATLEVRYDRFPDYWRGWNNPQTGGKYLETIITKGVNEWSTRKMQFFAGEFDFCVVPRANMWDLLDPADPSGYTPLSGIKLYYGQAGLNLDAMSPVWHLAEDSPYMSKVPAGGENAPELFADAHMRRALAQSLDFDLYLRDAWFNEAIQPTTWWVTGLAPDYKDYAITPFNLDLARVEAELKAATFGGQSIWDTGFETYLVYNLGNDQRKIACELVRDGIQSLNAKRAGKSPFRLNVVGLDWPVFLDYEEEFFMPVFFVGWLADFADADNFVRPYMHSYGDFSYFQGYSNTHADELIDAGIVTPDGPEREAIYKELQNMYHDDVVSIPLVQTLGRTWYREWCRGYYYNQLYPGIYFYDRWKETGAPVQPVDVSAVGSISAVGGSKLKRTPDGSQMTTLPVEMTIHRLDSNPSVAALFVIMALNRTDEDGYSKIIYGADALVVLTAAEKDHTEEFLWNETGAEVPAEGNYILSGVVNVISTFAYDNNPANNLVVSAGGTVEVSILNQSIDRPDQILIQEIINPQNLTTDVIALRLDRPLQPGDVITPVVNMSGYGHLPATSEYRANGTVWFYWLNDCPYAMFAHKTRYVFIDNATGEYEVIYQNLPPALNGEEIWRTPEEYWNRENWVYSSTTDFTEPTATIDLGGSVDLVASKSSFAASSESQPCKRALIIEGHNPYGSDFQKASELWYDLMVNFSYTDEEIIYLTPGIRAETDFICSKENVTSVIQNLANTMNLGDNLTVFIIAHGTVMDDNHTGIIFLNNWADQLYDLELKQSLAEIEDGVNMTIVFESCYSGGFIDDLWMLENVKAMITSTDWKSVSYTASAGLDPPTFYNGIQPDEWAWNDTNPLDEGGEFSSGLIEGLNELKDPFAVNQITLGDLYVNAYRAAKEVDAGYQNGDVLKDHYNDPENKPNPLLNTVFFEGDITHDGKVNILDISKAAKAYKSKPGDSTWDPEADVDKTGEIRIVDITKIAVNFGTIYY
jgi:peptide/nickel transport system substrate-binding protein